MCTPECACVCVCMCVRALHEIQYRQPQPWGNNTSPRWRLLSICPSSVWTITVQCEVSQELKLQLEDEKTGKTDESCGCVRSCCNKMQWRICSAPVALDLQAKTAVVAAAAAAARAGRRGSTSSLTRHFNWLQRSWPTKVGQPREWERMHGSRKRRLRDDFQDNLYLEIREREGPGNWRESLQLRLFIYSRSFSVFYFVFFYLFHPKEASGSERLSSCRRLNITVFHPQASKQHKTKQTLLAASDYSFRNVKCHGAHRG